MDQITTTTILMAAGYLPVIGAAIWYRVRVDRAVAALPDEVREALDWDVSIFENRTERLRHKRALTSRLILRAFPDWVPLPPAARNDLAMHRVLAFCAFAYLAVVPALIWSVPRLILVVGAPVAIMLALRAWWVGPWPEKPPSGARGTGPSTGAQ